MYSEIRLIDRIVDKRAKIKICLRFIKKYSEFKNHLANIGLMCVAGEEKVEAGLEIVKVQKHIEQLEEIIMNTNT